jgi:hypothetical protein
MLEPNALTFIKIDQFQERMRLKGFTMTIWKSPDHADKDLRRWDVKIEHARRRDHFGFAASDDLPDAILLACECLDRLTEQQFAGSGGKSLKTDTAYVLSEARRLLVTAAYL